MFYGVGGDNNRYSFNRLGYGSHQAIVERVRPGSRILDVGCASGYLMEYLRDAKRCDAIGIEPDLHAADQARKSGFAVIDGTAEEAFVTASDYQPFDHVIFGDVLEHMVNPCAVLSASRALMTSTSSTAIVSLPNIVCLRARLKLLRGVWRYEDTGIFDRTHLRFFSVTSGRALLAEAGFRINHESFIGPLTTLCGRLFLPVNAVRPNLLGSQMVFEASPIR